MVSYIYKTGFLLLATLIATTTAVPGTDTKAESEVASAAAELTKEVPNLKKIGNKGEGKGEDKDGVEVDGWRRRGRRPYLRRYPYQYGNGNGYYNTDYDSQYIRRRQYISRYDVDDRRYGGYDGYDNRFGNGYDCDFDEYYSPSRG
eukprot:Pgem_evm1s2412